MELVKDSVLDFFDSSELGFGDRRMVVFWVDFGPELPMLFVFRPYWACDRFGMPIGKKEMYC